MSKRDRAASAVLEWSPTYASFFQPGTERHIEAANLGELGLSPNQELIVALSRRTSFVKAVRVPDVPKAEVARVLQLQVGTLFPVAGAQLALDFILTDDVSPEGRLAVVAATRVETLSQLVDDAQVAGASLHQVVPVAFGSVLLGQSLGLRDCAVVEHAAEGLCIDIVSEGKLAYSRVAPFPKTSAELEAEVCRTFAIAKKPCGDTIAAGGLAFDGADHLVKTRVSEAFLLPGVHVPLSLELPEAAAARARKRVRTRARTAILLWLAVFVVALLVYFDRADAAAEIRRGEARWAADLRKLRSAKSTAETRRNKVAALGTTLMGAFEPAQKPYDVLTVVSNAVPDNTWLTGVTFERGKPLLIRGSTTSNEGVTTYLNRLKGDPRFRDVRLVFANDTTVERVTIVQFSISAHVVGNFPLVITTTTTRGGARQ
jgi:Tfp pilus assembly protein PilN